MDFQFTDIMLIVLTGVIALVAYNQLRFNKKQIIDNKLSEVCTQRHTNMDESMKQTVKNKEQLSVAKVKEEGFDKQLKEIKQEMHEMKENFNHTTSSIFSQINDLKILIIETIGKK